MEVTLVFPHQLFKEHPAVAERPVYLVEETLFFNQYNFHKQKQKLVLHRATMKMYAEWLESKNIPVHYIEAADTRSDIRTLITRLAEQDVTTVHYADVADNWLEKRLSGACSRLSVQCVQYTSPNFLNTLKDVQAYFDEKKSYFQTDFYIWQRKQRKLLLNKRELRKLEAKTKEKGYSIIPLKIFLTEKGFFKMEIGLGKGKKIYDKRETIKERDTDRDIKRKYGI